MNETEESRIIKQNEIIISLLGRLVYSGDKLRDKIIKKKQNSKRYVNGYNACDGSHTVSQIADVIGVTKGTLSPILQEWEDNGIVYSIVKGREKYYTRLYRIEESRKKQNG